MTDARRIFGKAPTMRLPGGGGGGGFSMGVIASGVGGVTMAPSATADIPLTSILAGSDAAWTLDGGGALVVPVAGLYYVSMQVGILNEALDFISAFMMFSGLSNGPGVIIPLDPLGPAHTYEFGWGIISDFIVFAAGDTILPNVTIGDRGSGTVIAFVSSVKAYFAGPPTNLPVGR